MSRARWIVIAGAGVAALCASGTGLALAAARIGTYDTRAIAVAWAHSEYNPVGEKLAEREQAVAAGDTARVRELEAWGVEHQRQLHRQGFGRVPVDDLLEPVKAGLPEVAARHGLSAIVFDATYVDAGVEVVDVTGDLVQLYGPSAEVLAIVEQMKGVPPLDLGTIEKIPTDE